MPLLGADTALELSEPDPFQIPGTEQLEAKIAELSALPDPAGAVARDLELYQSALTQEAMSDARLEQFRVEKERIRAGVEASASDQPPEF